MRTHHEIANIRFNDDRLIIIIDHVERQFPLASISMTLKNASNQERNLFEISPSGYGIHWPALDEDLSIDGLLGISHEIHDKKAA